MDGLFSIRPGTVEDYPQFLAAEQQAWKYTGVPVISPDQYASWLEVFPAGLLLAEYDAIVCGHVFSQICDFDPFDEADNRNWHQATDGGFIRTTHNPAGQTMYNVSVSACVPGAGKKLLRAAFHQADERHLHYYTGASSIPGLSRWAEAQHRPLNRAAVDDYVAGVLRQLKRSSDPGPKIRDPVISVTLSLEGTQVCRPIANYFDYPGSGGWAVLIAYACK